MGGEISKRLIIQFVPPPGITPGLKVLKTLKVLVETGESFYLFSSLFVLVMYSSCLAEPLILNF